VQHISGKNNFLCAPCFLVCARLTTCAQLRGNIGKRIRRGTDCKKGAKLQEEVGGKGKEYMRKEEEGKWGGKEDESERGDNLEEDEIN